MFFKKRIFYIFFILGLIASAASAKTVGYYGTDTPYPISKFHPYEKPPIGFTPIYTELVTRHGARSLTSPENIGVIEGLWRKAEQEHALTPLGKKLGPALKKLIKVNEQVGYGYLTAHGIQEQQGLGVRLYQRMHSVFTSGRKIMVVNSGIPRAEESEHYFVRGLLQQDAALKPFIMKTPALVSSDTEPVAPEPAGVNRFLLYFHALTPADLSSKIDCSHRSKNSYVETACQSFIHQAYIQDEHNEMNKALNQIRFAPKSVIATRLVLESLFSPLFVKSLGVQGQLNAAESLYALYAILPSIKNEEAINFSQYMPEKQAQQFAYLADAREFYTKGPSIQSSAEKNDAMAQILLDDFFNEVDAIARGDLSHAAKLRFSHAEIIMPFASLLRLKNIYTPTATDVPYTYENNPWRGEIIAPFSANIQWDVFRNALGILLVRMLYNEKEVDFKPACDPARYEKTHFYDYAGLKKCYGHLVSLG